MTNETIPSLGLKRCGVCELWQELDLFNRDATKKDGLNARCRHCERERYAAKNARIRARNRARNESLTLDECRIGPDKRCRKCRRFLSRTEFNKDSGNEDGLNTRCYDCERERFTARTARRKPI